MRTLSSILSAMLAAALLTIASSLSFASDEPRLAPAHADKPKSQKRRVVELELVGRGLYRLDGVEYDAATIGPKLAELDAQTNIRKLVLVDADGGTTIADIIDFAMLAKPIGAKPYHEVDGALREISVKLR
jgi:biopolymer transport protein ExbD